MDAGRGTGTGDGGFLAGAFAGTLLGARAGRRRMPAVLVLAAAATALAPLVPVAGAAPPALAVLAFAMGAQNAAMSKVGEVHVKLTFVTGTLTRLGAGLAEAMMGRRLPHGWVLYVGLWSGLVAGGAAGAALHGRLGLWALGPPVAAQVVLALAGWRRTASH